MAAFKKVDVTHSQVSNRRHVPDSNQIPAFDQPAAERDAPSAVFQQHQFEAQGLEIKHKHGLASLEEQQRLGVLQTKMAGYWRDHLADSSHLPRLSAIPGLFTNPDRPRAEPAPSPFGAEPQISSAGHQQPIQGVWAGAPPIQATLGVITNKGRVKYRRKSAISKNVPQSTGNRTAVMNVLYYWGQLNSETAFDSWEEAIDAAVNYIVELMDHAEADAILNLLAKADFDKSDTATLKTKLIVAPQKIRAEHITPTDVQTIDVTQDVAKVDVVHIDGELIEQIDMVHPIFREVVPNKSFIIVKLPQDVDAQLLQTPVQYSGKSYRIDLMAGSSLKPTRENSGSVFGIEAGSEDILQNLFGFEESAYYAQRALFSRVVAGATGKIRARTYAQEKGMEHTFLLKDGTPVQVDDGWGYIKKSLADVMAAGGMQEADKRQPKAGSGRASYQMMEWFDDEDLDLIEELAWQGFQQWQAAALAYLEHHEEADSEAFIESKRVLQSLLTTGRPPMEMAVAMPVTGADVVVPQKQKRYSQHLPGDISVMRSPADKQNFHPVSKAHVEKNAKISKLIGDIEGIQYTLTGTQDDALTFFKGMVGVIPDGQWPDAWQGVDLVMSSKDRKLFESWVRDSSLEQDPQPVEESLTDRATMSKAQQDFTIDGTLAAVQWFAKGNFVGVPPKIQKWLGGDYDGDELAMVFGDTNPELQRYIAQEAFQETEVNPKLTKTFQHDPQSSRAARMVEMRSPNVGNWSSIAARVRSLPNSLRLWLAEQTKDHRLLPDDPSLNGLEEVLRMEKEIQLGIKVGTDGYKTSVRVTDYEQRAGFYRQLLNQKAAPILHNKALMRIVEEVSVRPSLTKPAWRNIYFSYDEVDNATGEHVVSGVPARVLRKIIHHLLPPHELAQINDFYQQWRMEEPRVANQALVPNHAYTLKTLDTLNGDQPGTAQDLISNSINWATIGSYNDFEVGYLKAARWYWNKSNPATYAKANPHNLDHGWYGALIGLLKRYYLSMGR